MKAQVKQMPEDAFEAIVCQDTLLRFAQSRDPIPVADGVTITYGTFNVAVCPQIQMTLDISTPSSADIVWDASTMAILEGFDEVLRKMQFEELHREWLSQPLPQ